MISFRPFLRSVGTLLVTIGICATSTPVSAQNNCPDIQIEFDIPAVICFDPAATTVDLEVNVVGGDGSGSGQWSGAHITNTSNGFFRTTFATPGEQKVFYTYTENACTYRDSATFLYSRLNTPVFLAGSEQDGRLCQDSFSILRVISPYDTATTELAWNFDGGTATEQGSPDSLHVRWDSPGNKLIELRYQQYGCSSQPFLQQVTLDPVIDTPVVVCDNTLDRIVYEWEDPPNSSATIVFVISGPNGVADTTADRYTIENLAPGQTVQVRMVTTSKNTCDGNFIDPICSAVSCDESLIDLFPPDQACATLSGGDTIDIDYFLLDTITPATLTWSGAGIFDPNQARIALDPSMIGQPQQVYVTFASANCTIRDSMTFEVDAAPVATFSLPTTACQEEPVTARFVDAPLPPGSDTLLHWNFGEAIPSGDPASGVVDLSWTTPGLKTVALAMQIGDCISDTTYRFVNVQPAPAAAQISCEPRQGAVLFSWQSIPGATFDISVTEGPPGTRISTTSYLVDGLSAGQQVAIAVTTNGAGICNTRTATASCMPLDCPEISLDIDPIAPVCLTQAPITVDLVATADGGTGNGVFRWTGPRVNGSTWTPDSSLAGQAPFLYLEYQEGACRYRDSISVSVPEPVTADFDLPTAACTGATLPLEATGNFSPAAVFEWRNNGVANPSFDGPGPFAINTNQAGMVTVELIVTDNNCPAPAIVKSADILDPYPAPEISCSSSLDEVIFSWSPSPAPRQEVMYTGPGTGQRSSDTSFTISGLAPETAVSIQLNFSDDALPCRNSSAQADCSTDSCEDLRIDWAAPTSVCAGEAATILFTTQGAATAEFTIELERDGQLTIYDSITDGSSISLQLESSTTLSIRNAEVPELPFCEVALPAPQVITVEVPPTAPEQNTFPLICSNQDSLLELSGLFDTPLSGGQWSQEAGPNLPIGAFNPVAGTLRTGLLTSGDYQFRYQLSATGNCPAPAASLAIEILDAPTADAGPDQNLDCQFNMATLGSNRTSGGMRYCWQGPDASAIVDPTAPLTEVTRAGQYTLTVTNPVNGCTNSDEVTVTAAPDMVTALVTTGDISCFGSQDGLIRIDSITGGIPPYRIALNGVDQNGRSTFTNLRAGTYEISITSSDDCQATNLITLEEPGQLAVLLTSDIAQEDHTIALGDSVLLTALVNIPTEQIAQVIWQPEVPGANASALTRWVRPQLSTSYGVEIISNNGCRASDRIGIIVQQELNIFLPSAFSPNEDGVNDVFFMQAAPIVRQVRQFSIYNRWGKQVFANRSFAPNDPAAGWDGSTRNLLQPPGVYVYLAEVELSSGEITRISGDVTLVR